jgi:hypothetical protein
MRGSLVVLALAVAPLVANVSSAQVTTPPATPSKCILKQGGNPSDSGLIDRADPTLQGNKNCTPIVLGHTSISGTVFFDLNQNGQLDLDEVGLAGWQVQLTGPTTQSITTDGNGAYSFTGLSAGTYTVCVLAPMGWTQISPSSGATTCTSGIGYTIVAPAQIGDTSFSGVNFGFVSQ